jgi:uncharacterized protein
MKLVMNLNHLLKLREIVMQSTQKQIFISNPIIPCKFAGSYLATSFSIRNRIDILFNHYIYMNKYLSNHKICFALCDEITIWREIKEQIEYSVVFVLTTETASFLEGELAIEFRMDNSTLFRIAFTVIPGHMVGLQTEQTIFIGGSMGALNTARQTRLAAKSNHEISPAAILILAIQALGKTFDISTITGVSSRCHCSERVNRNTAKYYSTYDLMWEANGGVQQGDFFTFSITPYTKSLELVPCHHRSRSRKKRHMKLDLYKTFCNKWQQIFNGIL